MLRAGSLFLGLLVACQRWSARAEPHADANAAYKRSLVDEAYHNLPWEELSEFDFYPRAYPVQQPYHEIVEPDIEDDISVPQAELGTKTEVEADHMEPPSKTINASPSILPSKADRSIFPRSSFTFICPTSVQCDSGGCCAIGDYCAIRNGQLGCCPLGSLCDVSPIPGCNISCYGVCCDIVQGLVGSTACSSTTGDGGQASGICTGILSDIAHDAGLICDNVTLPGQPFCNLPGNVCPPGSKLKNRMVNLVVRQLNGTAIVTDDCLATTDTAAFASRITTTGSIHHGTGAATTAGFMSGSSIAPTTVEPSSSSSGAAVAAGGSSATPSSAAASSSQSSIGTGTSAMSSSSSPAAAAPSASAKASGTATKLFGSAICVGLLCLAALAL
ncbi:hypothetical protein LTR35_000684 [Friedmanniomyces endolithicus]|uniref:GPI anchored protein n=1 Tax=Friedmanniomyces endolithicus TaxID=329885 RepID=A0AAN6J135_9PEZI|nr:hypothetical protein LTS00_012203 [Friedmanniomyces endolithicus]KAK0292653.1 hypothetical protein LTR35_000684 [Friedmanniomyces endolithicus]KAK0306003.1 hypothetical protein LTR82_016559 [Friedmanniomyces endolithicus]KAK1007605.1 hypothetical protein LTR54_006331 [Friedmanniomyces endolithicus]